MQSFVIALALLGGASSSTVLISFDGADSSVPLSSFIELNDPVMGGKSTGTFTVDDESRAGIFDGEVVDVPSLSAPGFIKAAAKGTFPDASAAAGGSLVLTVRTTTPDYAGWRVSLAGASTLSPSYACSGGGSIPLSRGCFKAPFAVPAGDDFVDVTVPFASFSDLWSPSTGDITTACADDASACVDAKELAGIKDIEVWAEGANGAAHLEVLRVAVEPPAAAAAEPTAATPTLRGSASACATVAPLATLDVDEYARATWYSQQQQTTSYQPADALYCVAATYAADGRSVPFFSGEVLSAYNYATSGAVDGAPVNTANGTVLCARQADAAVAGGLSVAPCFLPNVFAGAYWVVAVGADAAGQYEWAVVSGGSPTVEQSDGLCTTSVGTYLGGLWIFTRAPVADDATVAAARAAATALGISTSQLVDVPQAGCEYTDAFIKA